MTVALALLLAAVAAGSLVYCTLTVVAASRYLAVAPAPLSSTEPVSILKPLSGADEGLEENLRSFFHPAAAFVEKHKTNPAMAEFTKPLHIRRVAAALPIPVDPVPARVVGDHLL